MTQANIGLILTGGGARAAYQAGVLAAIMRMLPPGAPSPFRIICGTSAGAINAALLAAHADNFGQGVRRIMRTWTSLQASSVHCTEPAVVARNLARWIWAVIAGGSHERPVSLLDNTPLRQLVDRLVDFSAVRGAIRNGYLDALCVTASSYERACSVSFFEGHASLQPWSRARRIGVPTTLGPEHLLGSAAIPFIYPPERIGDEHFGDGAVQQLAPISPALHLGADRVFIVGVGPTAGPLSAPADVRAHLSLGQIGDHLLDAIFTETLDIDLERLRRINETVALMPASLRAHNAMHWRAVDALVMTPSKSFADATAKHAHRLPPAIRMLLRALGAMGEGRMSVLSYLLTEGRFCSSLMCQGFRDAIARRADISSFLNLDVPASARRKSIAPVARPATAGAALAV
ncbi:MAG: patatin-like phospholipase family protein [Steroidobacteraceae bacterium]|jgi:NTE family protein